MAQTRGRGRTSRVGHATACGESTAPSFLRQMVLPTTEEGDTVLDPFAGSGTTGEVAVGLGLKAILIESSKLAQRALQDHIHRWTQPSLWQAAAI